MPEHFLDQVDLPALAAEVGTPFYVYSAEVLRRRIAEVRNMMSHPHLRARYAMKACSTRRILEEIQQREVWIDAVSGNEVLRAKAAGFPMGSEPPAVLLSADVFRDNSLQLVCEQGVLPNVGSPAMITELEAAGYHGPIAIRLNPGFGHGHVRECDTGGPSSKHGIWYEEALGARNAAELAGLPVVLLHAHIGSGPAIDEFTANMQKLAAFFAELMPEFPNLQAVNFGGGIPHPYRPEQPVIDLGPVGRALREAQELLSGKAGRDIRIEIEPGRYFVAPAAALVTRVHDIKHTHENDKGPGHTFVMVDAGFTDLVRPAMYGSYHHITVHGRAAEETTPVVVAGPLCESGDVFTRDARDFLDPRPLPMPKRGDLLILHDAGAYGFTMSSNYNSLGRPPQLWLEDGQAHLISRRESIEHITDIECFTPL